MYICANAYLSKCMQFGWEQGWTIGPKCIISLSVYVYGFRGKYTCTGWWITKEVQSKIPWHNPIFSATHITWHAPNRRGQRTQIWPKEAVVNTRSPPSSHLDIRRML